MKNKIKRAVISVVVFAVIYILSGFIIGWHSYDIVAAEPRCRKIDGVVCRRAPRNLSQNE